MKKSNSIMAPSLLWLFLFFVCPMFVVLGLSFAHRGTYGGVLWGFFPNNYVSIFHTQYLNILFDSFLLSSFTSVVCVFVALLISWAMVSQPKNMRNLFFLIIVIPFLTNLIIRIYALKMFVGTSGPVQSILTFFNISFDPYAFTTNTYLVYYGVITTYLPFAVLPIFSAFEKYNFSLIEAAQDLGASHFQVFFQVLIPTLRTPIINALLVVFIPCLGEFVIPDLLGGSKSMYLGNLITELFLKSRDWPKGAAIVTSLIIFISIIILLYSTKRKLSKNHV